MEEGTKKKLIITVSVITILGVTAYIFRDKIKALISGKKADKKPDADPTKQDTSKTDTAKADTSKGVVAPKKKSQADVHGGDVAPTPQPAPAQKNISDSIGTWLKSKVDGVTVRYADDGSVFKTINKGEDIGRIGDVVDGGYHRIFDRVDDDSVRGLKLADTWIKANL